MSFFPASSADHPSVAEVVGLERLRLGFHGARGAGDGTAALSDLATMVSPRIDAWMPPRA
jgi:hypothetical protein